MKDQFFKFERYLLTEKMVADNTVAAYRRDLKQLIDYLEKEHKLFFHYRPFCQNFFIYGIIGRL